MSSVIGRELQRCRPWPTLVHCRGDVTGEGFNEQSELRGSPHSQSKRPRQLSALSRVPPASGLTIVVRPEIEMFFLFWLFFWPGTWTLRLIQRAATRMPPGVTVHATAQVLVPILIVCLLFARSVCVSTLHMSTLTPMIVNLTRGHSLRGPVNAGDLSR